MKEKEFLDDINLPENIKPLYISLAKYLVYLNLKWSFYSELFGTENNSILLAYTAKRFFITIEQVLRYDMTLAICHLSEPSEYTNKESGKTVTSLSLETLINKCALTKDLQDLQKEFKKKSEPFSKLRNKLVAHRDLDVVLNPEANILPRINKEKVDGVIHLAERILLTISAQYGNTEEILFSVPKVVGGASDLIYWLGEGREYYDSTLRVLKEGHIPERFNAK